MATETVITKESPEIEAYKLGLMEQAKALTSAPPRGGLPGITSQGMTQEQINALNAARRGLGGYQPYLQTGAATMGAALPGFQAGQSAVGQGAGTLGQVGGVYAQGMGAPSQAQLDAYMNPYQQAVGDEISRAFDMQRSQADATAAQSGAFGGSRAAVQQSEIGRNQAAALAKAQADNFLQAQAAAQNEMNRAIQVGQGMTQLGQAQGQLGSIQGQLAQGIGQLGMQQAGLGELQTKLGIAEQSNLFALGEQKRAIKQAQDEARRQTKMQQVYEPYQRLGFYSDILRGAPSSQMTISQGANPQPNVLNQLLGAGIGGLSLYGAAQKAFG